MVREPTKRLSFTSYDPTSTTCPGLYIAAPRMWWSDRSSHPIHIRFVASCFECSSIQVEKRTTCITQETQSPQSTGIIYIQSTGKTVMKTGGSDMQRVIQMGRSILCGASGYGPSRNVDVVMGSSRPWWGPFLTPRATTL